MQRRSFGAAAALGFVATAGHTATTASPALDDAGTIVTVMQIAAKDKASRPELLKRIKAMRDYQRARPGYIDNAIMENRNPDAKPDYVGIARWKSLKDWEVLWNDDKFQNIVRAINEVGQISPGSYVAVK